MDKPIVDARGNRINLSTIQKNALYADAKRLKENIKDKLCSRDECNTPNDRNVNKMLRSEFTVKGQIEGFKKRMQAIGADPKEYDINRFRR
jgi:hypothetical protein